MVHTLPEGHANLKFEFRSQFFFFIPFVFRALQVDAERDSRREYRTISSCAHPFRQHALCRSNIVGWQTDLNTTERVPSFSFVVVKQIQYIQLTLWAQKKRLSDKKVIAAIIYTPSAVKRKRRCGDEKRIDRPHAITRIIRRIFQGMT